MIDNLGELTLASLPATARVSAPGSSIIDHRLSIALRSVRSCLL
jgi:hypothetical protein